MAEVVSLSPPLPTEAGDIDFSIVIPVYNRAATIMPTLESVVGQTHTRFTCLVVDDGSRDGEQLRMVVEALADPRFRYVRQENGGGGAARSTGIRAAEGHFIALLDSDDAFMPQKLERVAQHIVQQPDVGVWAHLASMERGQGVSIVRPTRLPRPGESVADMMFRDREFMQTSTLVARADLAKRVLFDPRLRKAQDVDFLIRLERAGARIVCIPEVLSIWNDAPADNRVGAPRRPDNVLMWYHEQAPLMGRRTRFAFESTYLAYEIADRQRFRAAYYIARAWLTGAVGAKVTLVTALRAFVDQGRYRALIDAVLKHKKR